jgi:DNA invertase Pin-like site-specific DNA recombinase
MLLGYARTSLGSQNTNLQTDALAQVCDRVWIEHASGSRRHQDRPELTDLLSHARQGDQVVVWRLDRLGRSTRDLLAIAAELEERGIGLRTLTEAWDTTTPSGRLIFTILSGVAEMERQIIIERTQAGLASARARGRIGGRPTVMTPTKILATRRLIHAGGSVDEISGSLGVSRASIYRYLQRELTESHLDEAKEGSGLR